MNSREYKEIVKEKLREVVSKLSLEICDKILRKKLPLRVRLLNKVECMGYGSTGVGQVMIYFNLNNDINSYQYIISSQEINKLLAKL